MTSNELKIETTVTFPDGEVLDMAVHITQELYVKAEVPIMIDDTLARVARAINNKIQEK